MGEGRRHSFGGGRPDVGQPPIADDVRREIEAHVRLAADDLVAAGWPEDQALAEARRRIGDETGVRRRSEHEARRGDARMRRLHAWEGMMQDVRYAVRSLTKARGFTAVALITLALGIGANTAVFTVVEGVLVRPLPYPASERLVRIWEEGQSGGRMSFSAPSFADVRANAGTLDGVAAYRTATVTVTGGAEPLRLPAAIVSADFWRVFGVTPLAGRLTGPDEHLEGGRPVAVLSEGTARRLFGTPADALGRTVETLRMRAEVVGVVAADFDYPSDAGLWVPSEPFGINPNRTSHNESVVARLAPGAALATAADEVDAIVARGAADALEDDPAYLPAGAHTIPLRDALTGDIRAPLLLLWAAAGFVLLVACTNLASTLLARGTYREREAAVRASLGATRGRLIRQHLTEALLLSLAGAALGLGVASLLFEVVRPLGVGSIPRFDEVGLSLPALAFTGGVALVTALLFGVGPALRISPEGAAQTLRGGRVARRSDHRVWNLLVSAEVALALVLLVGAGLMVRSFLAVTAQDPGVHGADVLTAPVSLPTLRYATAADRARFWQEQLPVLAELPGVAAVGLMTAAPAQGFVPTGRIQLDLPDNDIDSPAYVVASEGAFAALDIPLLRGRLFDDRDDAASPHVVVVNEAFVATFSPDHDVLGRRVTGGGMDASWNSDTPVFAEIVGVVGDVKHRELTEPADPTVYWNYRQRSDRLSTALVFAEARDEGDPAPLAPALRTALRGAESDLALTFTPLEEQMGEALRARTFALSVLGGFAVLALTLAGVGIYGVVSYTTARRTREAGIRMALGAEPTVVRRHTIGRAMTPVLLGVGVGTVGALWLTVYLESLLFGVSRLDPVTFVAVPLVLAAVGMVAAWIPAARSSRVSPTVAIQAE